MNVHLLEITVFVECLLIICNYSSYHPPIPKSAYLLVFSLFYVDTMSTANENQRFHLHTSAGPKCNKYENLIIPSNLWKLRFTTITLDKRTPTVPHPPHRFHCVRLNVCSNYSLKKKNIHPKYKARHLKWTFEFQLH